MATISWNDDDPFASLRALIDATPVEPGGQPEAALGGDAGILEAAFSGSTHALIDAIHSGQREAVTTIWRRLRRLYELLSVKVDEEYDTDPLFVLGRLVGMVEVADAAARRTDPPELTAALADASSCDILKTLLAMGQATSSELAAVLRWDPSTMSRRLSRLNAGGLIVSRKVGRKRVSRLPFRVEQALAERWPDVADRTDAPEVRETVA